MEWVWRKKRGVWLQTWRRHSIKNALCNCRDLQRWIAAAQSSPSRPGRYRGSMDLESKCASLIWPEEGEAGRERKPQPIH